MDQFNALSFFNIWCDFIEEEIIKKDKLKAWQSSHIWTNKTIGPKKSGKKDSPFGNFLKEKQNGWEYRKEDALVDLSIYRPKYLKKVMNLHPPGYGKYMPLDEKILNKYPIYYDILVEHENDITRAYEEMFKLTWYRAGLKVLITYNWDEDEETYGYVLTTLSENFRRIIRAANKKNPEINVEYLLIIGQKKTNNTINWEKFIYAPPDW